MGIRVCRGDFGVVRVARGEHQGRLGYYDEDDFDDQGVPCAIVYFGDRLAPEATYSPVRLDCLSPANAEEARQWYAAHVPK